jgi:hypothetical protein
MQATTMRPRDLPLACSLGAADAEARAARWRVLADRALTRAERVGAAAVLRYRGAPEVERELAELVALEAECCPFLDFALSRDDEHVVLRVSGPDEAAGIVGLFAAAA